MVLLCTAHNTLLKVCGLAPGKERIMAIEIVFVIILLMIGLPICLYVRHHRMKDLDVKISIFSGIKISYSFFKE